MFNTGLSKRMSVIRFLGVGISAFALFSCAAHNESVLSSKTVNIRVEYGDPGERADRGYFFLAVDNQGDHPICLSGLDATGEVAASFVVQSRGGRLFPKDSRIDLSRPFSTAGVSIVIIPPKRSSKVFVDLTKSFEFEVGMDYSLNLLLPVYECEGLLRHLDDGLMSSYQLRHRIDTSGDVDQPLTIPDILTVVAGKDFFEYSEILMLNTYNFTFEAS